eukprot:3935810-Rhodomonas_salina.3
MPRAPGSFLPSSFPRASVSIAGTLSCSWPTSSYHPHPPACLICGGHCIAPGGQCAAKGNPSAERVLSHGGLRRGGMIERDRGRVPSQCRAGRGVESRVEEI